MTNTPATPEHGHSQQEVEARIGAPSGRGYLRDMIYGGIDGAVTTFAIVAGVAGAGLSDGRDPCAWPCQPAGRRIFHGGGQLLRHQGRAG